MQESLRFSPAEPDSDLWRPWWYALGRSRGLSFDVADPITEALVRAGFVIQRRDRLAQCSGTRADLGPTVVQIEGPLHRSACRPVCVVAECRIATLLEHAGPNSEIVTPARLLGGVRRCG
jgi:hypothetical protein